MVYQVLLGIPPFVASSEYFVFRRIQLLDLSFPSIGISPQAVGFIKSIVITDRTRRLSIEEILRHPFLDGLPVESPQLTDSENYALKAFLHNANSPLVDLRRRLAAADPGLFTRISWCQEWKDKSVPGAGAAALRHLNLAELKEDYDLIDK